MHARQEPNPCLISWLFLYALFGTIYPALTRDLQLILCSEVSGVGIGILRKMIYGARDGIEVSCRQRSVLLSLLALGPFSFNAFVDNIFWSGEPSLCGLGTDHTI